MHRLFDDEPPDAASPQTVMSENPLEPTPELPQTVSHIELDGRNIYLVGTAHVSKSSVCDVETTIAAVQPDTVCVELCRPRYKNLANPESWRNVNILEVLRKDGVSQTTSAPVFVRVQRTLAPLLGDTSDCVPNDDDSDSPLPS